VRNLPPPIPTGLPTNDDVLYFDVPDDLRGKVPQRVIRIQVDAEKLRILIAEQTRPASDLLPAFKTEEIRACGVPTPAVDLQGQAPSYETAADANPPFDYEDALSAFAAREKKIWRERPSEKDAIAFALKIYAHAPRDQIRKIMTELWGPGKPGPRNPRN
jgi:hypothetical protein